MLDNLAQEYAEILKQKMGHHIRNIVLFGSHARGDAHEGSDYDFLVIVDQRTAALRELVLDAGVEMMNRHERLFTALIYDETEWEKAKAFPLGWHIERDGVVI